MSQAVLDEVYGCILYQIAAATYECVLSWLSIMQPLLSTNTCKQYLALLLLLLPGGQAILLMGATIKYARD